MATNPTDLDLCDFLDECGWSASTLSNARSILRRWEAYCGELDVAVLDADHRHLRPWIDPATGLAGATLHKRWQTVGAFYGWAATPIPKRSDDPAGAGLLDGNPMARVRPPHVPVTLTARIATEDQAHELEAHFARQARAMRGRGDGERERALRNAALVSLMMRAGLRSSDVAGLDLDHLVRDERGDVVAVTIGGDDGMRTKSRRRRMAPVVDETPALLARYLRARGMAPGPLFLGRRQHTADPDGRMSARAVQDVVRRAAKACGLELSSHDLRRGFAVTSANRGVDRGWIKTVAGWGNDQMLDRYLGAKRDEVAVEAFRAAIGDRRLRRSVAS
jgi:integrase